MKKIKMLFVAIAILACGLAYGQNITVTGVVTDASTGEPLSGAAILVKGTPQGVVADNDGHYSIVVSPNATLGFTTIGFKDVEESVNGRTVINVALQPDLELLDEVVVTATGMTRQEKTLGYASTTVRSEELIKGHAADALSGLQGKVAGVQISSSGATGTSQKVIVRGYSSLSSNAPLYVVDGVPMSNGTMGVMDLNNSIDFGNQASDINPEDIESITILKGASATALYGSRAGNGAILITTKRGQQNEDVKVTYNGAFQVSSVLRIPNLQNKFGQGWFYSEDGNYFENWGPSENGSWGNVLDGREVYWRPGATWYNDQPMSYTNFDYKTNSLKNFYSTGFEANNSVSIQGGSKTTGFVVSYGNIYSDGILPGNDDFYKRNNISVRGNTKIKDGLAWINYGLNYVRKDVKNAMTGQGGDGSVIYNDILQYPVNIDYGEVKDYNNIYNNADNYYTPYAMNPFWILDHNWGKYTDDRVYGNVEFGLQLMKGLQLIARGGLDTTNYIEEEFNDIWNFTPGSFADDYGASAELGKYERTSYRTSQLDANVFLNAEYRIGEDWSIHAVAGANANQRASEYTSGVINGIAIPGWSSFNNTSGATPEASKSLSLRRLLGAYAQADFGWRDALYLTLSARNDWSSTLPIDANSYFYWGANASAIVTDLIPSLKGDVLSFLKIRGGYGQTGNDAPTYYTSAYYNLASAGAAFGSLTFPLNSFVGLSKSTRVPSTTLRPEISTESEFGIDARFFDNRINVDLAFYNKLTKDQIISATLAPESGYGSAVRNIGAIRNKGIELSLGLVPVRTDDFEWEFTYIYSKNTNIVEKLWDDVEEYTIYGLTDGPQLKAKIGESLCTWVDYPVSTVTDKNSPYYGYTIVNATTGLPTYDSNAPLEKLGTADPKFNMGFNNVIRFKNFSLGFNFDWRKGGLMYSATKGIVRFCGNDEDSMFNMRDAWVYPHSVYKSGNDYVENNLPVNSYYNINGIWYDNYNYVAARDNLLDKSYVKLRELNITYQLPRKWFDNINWLSTIDLSIVGRNLFMWTPNQGLLDPDTTNYGNDLTSQYGEFYSSPSTRTVGGNIKIVF